MVINSHTIIIILGSDHRELHLIPLEIKRQRECSLCEQWYDANKKRVERVFLKEMQQGTSLWSKWTKKAKAPKQRDPPFPVLQNRLKPNNEKVWKTFHNLKTRLVNCTINNLQYSNPLLEVYSKFQHPLFFLYFLISFHYHKLHHMNKSGEMNFVNFAKRTSGPRSYTLGS